jgi:hypothetical protein
LSEPQSGKSSCDRAASLSKLAANRAIDEGVNCKTSPYVLGHFSAPGGPFELKSLMDTHKSMGYRLITENPESKT